MHLGRHLECSTVGLVLARDRASMGMMRYYGVATMTISAARLQLGDRDGCGGDCNGRFAHP